MGKAPAFQLYAADFVMGTNEMDPAEVGCYVRMLCHQWVNESAPSEKGSLFRICGTDPSPAVLAKFKLDSQGRFKNVRLEVERLKQVEYREKQAKEGKKGGRPRKGSERVALSEPKGFEKGSLTSSPSGEDTPAAGVCVTPPAETLGEVVQLETWRLTSEELAPLDGKPKEGNAGSARKRPPKKQNGVFVAPTEAEVAEYCRERKNGLDPEQFVDFYASKGWKVGGQPMKDWKASVRTWEKRNGNAQEKPHVRDVGHSVEEIMEFRRQMGE